MAQPKIDRRGWLSLLLQKRRRARLLPAPNAPVITFGEYEWGNTTNGFADIYIEFYLDFGDYDNAIFEVWVSRDGGEFSFLFNVETFYSDFTYHDATDVEAMFDFKLRYVNGAIIGPFSNPFRVDIQV